jgi:integrase
VEVGIERGVFVDTGPSSRASLAVLIDRFITEVVPAKKSAGSLTRCLQVLKRHFGRHTLASLRPADVALYRDQRIAAGRAGGTVIKELNVLSLVIDCAIKDWGYYLAGNPVESVRRPAAARGRERRLSIPEHASLIASCKESGSPLLTALVELALETGMRLGELLALRWPHIDHATRVARLLTTKNGDARSVPLSPQALRVLITLPRHIGTERVFWSWSRADSVENVWRRAVRRAGLSDLRFHDLRHKAVSRLFERGLNVMEVAAISGHRSLQMLRRYTHLDASSLAHKLASIQMRPLDTQPSVAGAAGKRQCG